VNHTLPSKIKQNYWDLEIVLPLDYHLPKTLLAGVSEEIKLNFARLLSRDVYSEGDAKFLYDRIQADRDRMSPEFLATIDLWLADELKHYQALRRTYHLVTGISFSEMDRTFAQRAPQIEPIAMLLTDEFTILVAMMFDELGSTYSYRRDLREYYCHFGDRITAIGHHLVKDEGMHFSNAAELLLTNHRDRLGEVKGLLAQISSLEKSLRTYYHTFFLDHAQEQYRFPPYFNDVLIQAILARLGLAQQPPRSRSVRSAESQLQQLWQWIPEKN
jgi:hypothetical protein